MDFPDNENVRAEVQIVLHKGDARRAPAPAPVQPAIPTRNKSANRTRLELEPHQITAPATKGQARPVGGRAGHAIVMFATDDRFDVETDSVMPALRVAFRIVRFGLIRFGVVRLCLLVRFILCHIPCPIADSTAAITRFHTLAFLFAGVTSRGGFRFFQLLQRSLVGFFHRSLERIAELAARGADGGGMDRNGAVLIRTEVECEPVGRPDHVTVARVGSPGDQSSRALVMNVADLDTADPCA
jgi:hypothetical protein